MDQYLKKYRDRLRILAILYVFSEPLESHEEYALVFKTEIKIQALDFLLRYPDFLSLELLDLYENQEIKDQEIRKVIQNIFSSNEPVLRVDEMEKFFHGAYESIDDTIAFLSSISFIKYESKKRRDGKKYEKTYHLTHIGKEKIESQLSTIESAKWYMNRCALIKKYFGQFSGSDLKKRQYRYAEEYASVPYKGKIKQVELKVRNAFYLNFNEILA